MNAVVTRTSPGRCVGALVSAVHTKTQGNCGIWAAELFASNMEIQKSDRQIRLIHRTERAAERQVNDGCCWEAPAYEAVRFNLRRTLDYSPDISQGLFPVFSSRLTTLP